ncbi:MAG TPA: efflux RND transporter periplasmic adaptor subunit [Anaeromyxobacteraceae bacterium]|nr:efflux RND transporter periplasmic adaptor subunit [Anaeromyxobacteraceae bacterium]
MAWTDHLARPSSWSRGARWAAAAAAALVLLAAAAGLRGRAVPVYVAEKRPLVQRVVATGRVTPLARVDLASLVPGRVEAVEAREGDRVAAGQVLVRLEDAEARAAVSQAEGRLAEARARLDQVGGAGSKQAELRAAQAARDLERARDLFGAGSASRAELDEAEKALELARSQQESAAALASSASRSGAEFRLAAAVLRQAQGALAAAEARLSQTRIGAPGPGVVLGRKAEPGDVVAAGETVLVLALDGETLLTADLDERNLALLRVGQEATAVADAFPDRPFRAAVSRVAPAVDPARGTVEVRLRVPEPPGFLRPDLTVSVNVDVGRREQAVVVPADAVRDASGTPWVLVLVNGRAARREVRLGLRGEAMVEIAEGLAPGEAVVPAAARAVGPGQRVRPDRVPLPPEAARAL